MNRCMPWYLAAFCVADRHHHGTGLPGAACRAHDRVMCWWMFRYPAAMTRFDRKFT